MQADTCRNIRHPGAVVLRLRIDCRTHPLPNKNATSYSLVQDTCNKKKQVNKESRLVLTGII